MRQEMARTPSRSNVNRASQHGHHNLLDSPILLVVLGNLLVRVCLWRLSSWGPPVPHRRKATPLDGPSDALYFDSDRSFIECVLSLVSDFSYPNKRDLMMLQADRPDLPTPAQWALLRRSQANGTPMTRAQLARLVTSIPEHLS